jgi:hypothetical protein
MADVSLMLLHSDTSLGSVMTEQRLHVNTNGASRVLHCLWCLSGVLLNT